MLLTELVADLYRVQPDKRLYHYTTTCGLRGIVRDKKIWATDYRYLNDAAEVGHLRKLVDAEVEARLQPVRSETDSFALSGTEFVGGSLEQQQDYARGIALFEKQKRDWNTLRMFQRWLEEEFSKSALVYVSSFVEHDDLLSQWRGYSEFGRGVCIGFDPGDMAKVVKDTLSVSIGRCVYDERRTNTVAVAIVDAIISSSDENAVWLSNEFKLNLFKIAALAKHPKFKEEDEWRMISVATPGVSPTVEFREGTTGLIPYVELSLPTENSVLAARQVRLGPTSTPELSKASIAQFLETAGVRAEVVRSEIPYRGR